jgi:hypothetical protein
VEEHPRVQRPHRQLARQEVVGTTASFLFHHLLLFAFGLLSPDRQFSLCL